MNKTIACNFENILKKVQICKSSHQKNLKVLEQLYGKVEQNEFLKVLFTYLKKKIFPMKNEFVERILLFLAQFVACMTPIIENEALEDDSPSHPFLRDIVSQTLECHNVQTESVRYNSCLFLRLILQNIGHETRLDNDICDFIQDAMLERTNDPKPAIRQQAVLALIRLQDPLNPECPVIKAYLSLIVDSNSLIRADVVKNIAPYSITIPHLLSRLKDTDVNVRIMAFRRCADLGPRHFKIVERQYIINCGLTEDNTKAKKVFVDNLLMKWLNVYNRNFLEFFNALKLDADETDFITSEQITKDVLTLIIDAIPVKEVVTTLPLKNKLISFEDLTSEAVTVWNVLFNFLRQSDDAEEFLNDILPELTPFCDYIESVVNKKNETHQMAEWEYLTFQYIMYNLFEIVENYDFSDEVGRRRLNHLVLTVLKEEDLQYRLLKKVVILAEQVKSKNDSLIDIICHLISEIREPLIEKTVSPEKNPDSSFLIAQLKVKINVLESELEDATDMQEFLKANTLKEEIIKLKTELKDFLEPQPTVEVVKVSKDDPKTICRCLDLLIALLELPSTTKLTTFLITIKDEFVLPLLHNSSNEVNWRVLNCLGLYCLLEQELAEEYVKILLIPLITYRAIPNYDKLALTTSVKAMSDLFRIYGTKIFGSMDETSQNTSSLNHTKRRLYRNEDDEKNLIDPNRFHFESAIEIMLDMLDDENPDIRNCAVLAIAKLILSNFPVTPSFITRILLKWYNPLTARMTDNVQQILGISIANYANFINGAREIISKAVVPILISITSAPRTSPLVDVDVDNLLQFLAAITNSGNKGDVVNTHLNLAHTLCHEISKKKDCSVVLYLTKMLLCLDIPSDNVTAVNEIMAQVQNSLEEETIDKLSKKYLQKFLAKLNDLLKQANQKPTLNTINENSCESANMNESEQRGRNEKDKESESNYNIENNSSDNSLFDPRIEVASAREIKTNKTEKPHEKLQENRVINVQTSTENVLKQIENHSETPQKSNSMHDDYDNQSISSNREMGNDNENMQLKTTANLNKSNENAEKNKIQKNYKTNKGNMRKSKRKKYIEKIVASEQLSNSPSDENLKNSDALKKTRSRRTTDNSSTDNETGRHNKKRKVNYKVNTDKTSTSSNSQNSDHSARVTRSLKRGNVKSNNIRQCINDIWTDSESGSPKKKKMKVMCVKLLKMDNSNKKNKKLRSRTTMNVNVAKHSKLTEVEKGNVDGTMSFSNVNFSNCSFKPVIESTAINNGTLPGSTLIKSRLRKSSESISKRNSNHRNPDSTLEETVLRTINESSEIQTSRLSTSPFSSNKSFTSERNLRSKNVSLSSTPSSNSPAPRSPIIRMQRISKTSETGSRVQQPKKKI